MTTSLLIRAFLPAVLLCLTAAPALPAAQEPGTKTFRAGAAAVDITPEKFPVIVNGGFLEGTAGAALDRLHARCLVLDDGTTRLALVVVDSCMMPRDLLDEVRKQTQQTTGIPADRLLISATHTHSAPSVMGALGSRADEGYRRFLGPQIVRAVQLAVKNLQPARLGWTVVQDFEHTHCRRWIYRPDRLLTDPFGGRTVRANMHPGYQNPNAIGPSGPVDPDLSLLAVQSASGRPLALLANYSMHYYGSAALSADYYGRFAEGMEKLLGKASGPPPFVAMMSQGTSGDLMWMNYGQPAPKRNRDAFAAALVEVAHRAYQAIQYQDWVPLAMKEALLKLRRRTPSDERLAWARKTIAQMKGKLPKSIPEVYALEQVHLHENPTAELRLQALRIGALGITAIPDEVYGITGLKLKAQSPLVPTFNIELANGSEGYIPPPEQHQLGGYTTWPARTAGLEVQAEPKIVATLLELLEAVSGKPRRKAVEPESAYTRAVLAAKPLACWRLGEFGGPHATDATGNGHTGRYEAGLAFYLDGAPGAGSRAVHFAGGRLAANLDKLGGTYTVEGWLWNGLPSNARAVTGYLFSRGADGDTQAAGDHLGLGGTDLAAGKLLFVNGTKARQSLAGVTELQPKTWYHVALVRDGRKVRVYLNGNPRPEIAGESEVTLPAGCSSVFVGGRCDRFATWEGKLDEVAVHARALSPKEIGAHYRAAGQPPAAR